MSAEEHWLPVPGYEGYYEVSDVGRVRSLDRYVDNSVPGTRRLVKGRILSPRPNGYGYPVVALSRHGGRKMTPVHRIVLAAFVGPRPPGLVGCHNDGNPGNNVVRNLRYDTQSENGYDTVRHGRNLEALKTRCLQGHEFTAENTYINTAGARCCRTCRRAYNVSYRVRLKAAA